MIVQIGLSVACAPSPAKGEGGQWRASVPPRVEHADASHRAARTAASPCFSINVMFSVQRTRCLQRP